MEKSVLEILKNQMAFVDVLHFVTLEPGVPSSNPLRSHIEMSSYDYRIHCGAYNMVVLSDDNYL